MCLKGGECGGEFVNIFLEVLIWNQLVVLIIYFFIIRQRLQLTIKICLRLFISN